jgi:two-component system chemotaxis response regulator CheB
MAIKHAGGVAIVQDPQEAFFSILPNNVIEKVPVDRILPVAGIAQTLQELAYKPIVEGEIRMQEKHNQEARVVADSMANFEQGKPAGASSVLTCPECGGVMWELQDGEFIHYRCHVGHDYSSESLFAEQALALEAALWTAIRSLEERASLCRRMAAQAGKRNSQFTERRFQDQADELERNADVIRRLVLNRKTVEALGVPHPGDPGSGRIGSGVEEYPGS